MRTTHRLVASDAREIALDAQSVALVVTSPPYPMIAMWDNVFAAMSSAVPPLGEHASISAADGAFEAMHAELDRVWAALWPALVPGGVVCVNIGDATRTLGGQFRRWPNAARITMAFLRLGFDVLPDILWRKPTNAPNKFMGSGMLPGGAYVTYEHEYILIFRKGKGRVFTGVAQVNRARSAYFWEERNRWFSDLWDGLAGVGQAVGSPGRDRSAAYPLALPHRLIQMFSSYEDTVLDPFIGTGTTSVAAAGLGRNSIGIEHDGAMLAQVPARMLDSVEDARRRAGQRLRDHAAFVQSRLQAGKQFAHHNTVHDLPVVTRQERTIEVIAPARMVESELTCTYETAFAGLALAPLRSSSRRQPG